MPLMRTIGFLLLAFLRAAGAAAEPVPSFSALFDGSGGAISLGLPAAFKPSAPPAARRPARGTPPTVGFNGERFKTVLFSGQDRIAESLDRAIAASRSTIRAALYEITLPETAAALVEAKQRGVDVRVVFDYSHSSSADVGPMAASQLETLLKGGIPVRLLRGGGQYGIMHNKFAVFDGRLLETGSFNWTLAANNVNYENALFRDDDGLIAGFSAYWDWMWAQGKPAGDSWELEEAAAPRAPPSDPSPALDFKGSAWPSYIFSPKGGVDDAIVRAIGLCDTSVEIAMFSFFSQSIGQALLRAKQRGVAVRLVLDRRQGKNPGSLLKFFTDNGFDVRLSAGRGGQGVLHDKFGVYDGRLLETGSYNYTLNANLNNYENAVFSTSAWDLEAFQAEFETLYAQAQSP